MGRTPNSIDHHKATGNYRESRHGRDGLPVERPEGFGLPGNLDPNGQAFWNCVVSLAEFAGYLTRIDGPLLRLAAENWSLYCDAREEVRKDGVIVEKATRHGVVKLRNPGIDVMDKAETKIIKILDRFGFSPRMRTALTTNLPDTDDEEELARSIFGGAN